MNYVTRFTHLVTSHYQIRVARRRAIRALCERGDSTDPLGQPRLNVPEGSRLREKPLRPRFPEEPRPQGSGRRKAIAVALVMGLIKGVTRGVGSRPSLSVPAGQLRKVSMTVLIQVFSYLRVSRVGRL